MVEIGIRAGTLLAGLVSRGYLQETDLSGDDQQPATWWPGEHRRPRKAYAEQLAEQVGVRAEQEPGPTPARVEGEPTERAAEVLGRPGGDQAVADVASLPQDLLEQGLHVAGVQELGIVDQDRQRPPGGVEGHGEHRGVWLGTREHSEHARSTSELA